MSELPFDNFECDNCGACCEGLIIEAHDYDARREPKLYEIGSHPVDRKKLREGEHCIMLYDPDTRRCPFLKLDGPQRKVCGIYETRPHACVMVEAGDAKCQQARVMAGLPFLRDKEGNEPTRELLAESCEDYQLEVEELYQ